MVNTWVPNRKVLSGVAGGAIASLLMWAFGIDFPDPVDTAIGVAVVGIIAYWVPLPPEE